jgi:Rod binding domain-containing protein
MSEIKDLIQFASQVTNTVRSHPAGAKPMPGDNKDAEIEKACQEFESLFVHHMMQQMRQTVPTDGLFGGGTAEKMYTSMLDGEIAKTVSAQRGIGLAPMLIRQMVEMAADKKK